MNSKPAMRHSIQKPSLSLSSTSGKAFQKYDIEVFSRHGEGLAWQVVFLSIPLRTEEMLAKRTDHKMLRNHVSSTLECALPLQQN